MILILTLITLMVSVSEQQVIADDRFAPVEITSEIYDQQVINSQTLKPHSKPWFIKFYAPWCGHCKKLAPLWNQLAEDVVEEKQNLAIGKINCDEERALCQTYGVRGFPTLILIKEDGKFYKYDRERSVDKFKQFALKEGYVGSNDQGDIPAKISSVMMFMQTFGVAMQQIGNEIAKLVDKVGFKDFSKNTKIIIGCMTLLVPLILLCLIFICMDDKTVDPVNLPKPQVKAKKE